MYRIGEYQQLTRLRLFQDLWLSNIYFVTKESLPSYQNRSQILSRHEV